MRPKRKEGNEEQREGRRGGEEGNYHCHFQQLVILVPFVCPIFTLFIVAKIRRQKEPLAEDGSGVRIAKPAYKLQCTLAWAQLPEQLGRGLLPSSPRRGDLIF